MKLYFEDYNSNYRPSSEEMMNDRSNNGYRRFLELAKRYFTDSSYRDRFLYGGEPFSGPLKIEWNAGDVAGVLKNFFGWYKQVNPELSDNHMLYARTAMEDCLNGKYDWVKI